MTPLIVIPAAGASSRMRGRDKLLERIGGEPLLRRQARRAVATGYPVMVCLPKGDTARRAALHGLTLAMIEVQDADEGMGATLRAAARFAARHAPDRPFGILLPDVPGIESDDIAAVATAFTDAGGDRPARATDPQGRPGTPLVVPARLLAGFAALTGDDGGRSALLDEDMLKVPFPDDRATRDLDTPEDWASWRSQQPSP